MRHSNNNNNSTSLFLSRNSSNSSSTSSSSVAQRLLFSNLGSSTHQRSQMSNNNSNSGPPSVHPQFRCKSVCKLSCKHCGNHVCHRGMKAILLGDTRVELFSTDTPPNSVQLVEKDYMTRNCRCRIRDVACLGCGNVIGYHVTQPCDRCLEACNNGHFWMFVSEGVVASDRVDPTRNQNLIWANLPSAEQDAFISDIYELLCR